MDEMRAVKIGWHYTMFENAILEDSDMTGNDLLVYIALCYHADTDTRACFPGMARICSESRLSRSSVIRALKHLVDNGYIIKTTRKKSENPSMNDTNLYIIPSQYVKVKKPSPPAPKPNNPPKPSIADEWNNKGNGSISNKACPHCDGSGFIHDYNNGSSVMCVCHPMYGKDLTR